MTRSQSTPCSSQLIWAENRIKELEEQLQNQQEVVKNVYKERNILVALLARIFPSGLQKTSIEGWDEAWHNCVYIEFPWGQQASWHFHDTDKPLFEGIGDYWSNWDGHSTEEKYQSIINYLGSNQK